MEIALLYNQSAGFGVRLDEIRAAIERRHHDIVVAVGSGEDGEGLADVRADLVVVAGGDGTVAAAVRMLAGRARPLAILPMGTANNIAATLGVTSGTLSELVGRWEAARRVPLDLGVVTGTWGRRYFVEGVGCGLVPRGIAAVERTRADEEDDPLDRVARAQHTFRDVLERLRPRRLSVRFDGTTLTGEFLLVEVMNIRSVGPNLVLCPDANPSDGYFGVVVAAESEREELARYLRRASETTDARLRLPVHRARQVDIEGPDSLHLDDVVARFDEIGDVSARVAPSALEVLV